MATLDSVPEADRADFAGRLALFNIDPSSFLADELTTAASTITTLSLAPGVTSRFQPVILRTSDFGQLNKWVGVPDRVFERGIADCGGSPAAVAAKAAYAARSRG